jgi:hypothetical protein
MRVMLAPDAKMGLQNMEIDLTFDKINLDGVACTDCYSSSTYYF